MITDSVGRPIAPPQHEPAPRPDGPWTSNAAPFTFQRDGATHTCAWHPGFDATHPANIGASHGICATCQRRMEREGSW